MLMMQSDHMFDNIKEGCGSKALSTFQRLSENISS